MRRFSLLWAWVIFCLFPLMGQQLTEQYGSQVLFRSGYELLQKQKYSAAQDYFERYIAAESGVQSFPNDGNQLADAHFYQALCAYHLLRQDAEYQLQHFVDTYPTHSKVGMAKLHIGKLFYIKQQFHRAIPQLAQVDPLTLSPEEYDESQFMLGYAYFMTNKHDKALQILRPVCKSNSEHGVHANYYYGIIQYQQKNYPDALSAFQSIDKEELFRLKIPIYITTIYLNLQEYDRLDQYGSALLAQNAPYDQRDIIYKQIGTALFELGRFKQAIPYFEANVENNAKPDPFSFYRLGYSHFQLKEYEPACFYFNKLIKGQDTLAQASAYYIGYSFAANGKLEESRLAFKRAYEIGLHPQFTREALMQYAKSAFETKFYEEAYQAFLNYINAYPKADNILEVKGLMGEILFLTGNYKGAIERLEDAPRLNPRGEAILQKAAFNHAAHLHQQGSTEEAQKYYRKASQSTADEDIAYTASFWQGEILYHMKRFEEAERHYRRFADSKNAASLEYYPEAMLGLGWCNLNQKDYNQAVNYFKKAMDAPNAKNKPDVYVEAGLRAGDCRFLNKKYQEALKYYQSVYQFKQSQTDYALYQIGLCKLRLENRAQGFKDLDYLIENHRNSEWRDDALLTISSTYLTQALDNKNALGYAKALVNEHPNSPLVPKAYLNIGFANAYMENKEEAIYAFKNVLFEHGQHQEEVHAALDQLSELLTPNDLSDMIRRYQRQFPNTNVKADNIVFNVAREQVLTHKDYQSGLEQLSRFIADYPNSKDLPEALLLRGMANEELKRIAQALIDYEQLGTKQAPADLKAKALVRSGDIYVAQKDYPKAIECYNKATHLIDNANDLIQVQFKLGNCYLATKNFNGAQTVFMDITRNPGVTAYSRQRATMLNGHSLYGMGKLEPALEAFQQVEKSQKDVLGAESQYMICQILLDQKQLEAAKKAVFYMKDQYTTHNFWKANAFIVIAEVYRAEGDYFQAIETLKSIIQHSSDQEIKSKAKQRLDVFEVESKDPNLNKNLFEEEEEEEEETESTPSTQQSNATDEKSFEQYDKLYGQTNSTGTRSTPENGTPATGANASNGNTGEKPRTNNGTTPPTTPTKSNTVAPTTPKPIVTPVEGTKPKPTKPVPEPVEPKQLASAEQLGGRGGAGEKPANGNRPTGGQGANATGSGNKPTTTGAGNKPSSGSKTPATTTPTKESANSQSGTSRYTLRGTAKGEGKVPVKTAGQEETPTTGNKPGTKGANPKEAKGESKYVAISEPATPIKPKTQAKDSPAKEATPKGDKAPAAAGTYYIIVGTAGSEEKANQAITKWKDKGFKPVKLPSTTANSNLFRISIYQTPSKEAADKMRREWVTKGSIPAESWVHKQ